MHELTLATNAVALIEAAAQREHFRRVRVVWMEVGVLACVEAEALRFAFESAVLGSCAEGARLEIVAVAAVGACPVCGHRAAMETLYDACPACDNGLLQARQGTELRIRDLDVE